MVTREALNAMERPDLVVMAVNAGWEPSLKIPGMTVENSAYIQEAPILITFILKAQQDGTEFVAPAKSVIEEEALDGTTEVEDAGNGEEDASTEEVIEEEILEPNLDEVVTPPAAAPNTEEALDFLTAHIASKEQVDELNKEFTSTMGALTDLVTEKLEKLEKQNATMRNAILWMYTRQYGPPIMELFNTPFEDLQLATKDAEEKAKLDPKAPPAKKAETAKATPAKKAAAPQLPGLPTETGAVAGTVPVPQIPGKLKA